MTLFSTPSASIDIVTVGKVNSTVRSYTPPTNNTNSLIIDGNTPNRNMLIGGNNDITIIRNKIAKIFHFDDLTI